jgi:hypothetical protein
LLIAQYLIDRGISSVMGTGRAVEQIEEQIILTSDIPDEALEGAAETGKGGCAKDFTVACTGLAACPS